MPFGLLRNPLSGILGAIRGVVSGITSLSRPLGSAIGQLGRALSRAGAVIETTAIRARVERELALERASQQAAGGAARGLLRRDEIPLATTKLRREYSYRVGVDWLNPATGKVETRYVAISSDTLLQRHEAEQRAETLIAEEYRGIHGTVVGLRVTGITRAGEAGRL